MLTSSAGKHIAKDTLLQYAAKPFASDQPKFNPTTNSSNTDIKLSKTNINDNHSRTAKMPSRKRQTKQTILLVNQNPCLSRTMTGTFERPEPAQSSVPTTFPFQWLPKELRLEIYEYILKPEYLMITSKWSSGLRAKSITAQMQISGTDEPVYYAKGVHDGKEEKTLYPAILRTCNQIHAEAKTILYRPETLILSPLMMPLKPKRHAEANIFRHHSPGTVPLSPLTIPVTPKRHAEKRRQLPVQPSALSAIHRLEALQIDIKLHADTNGEALVHWKSIAQHLNSSLVARSITINVQVCWYELAVARPPIQGDVPRTTRAMAEQLAIFRLLRDALGGARYAEQVRICYDSQGMSRVNWTKDRGGEWREEKKGVRGFAVGDGVLFCGGQMFKGVGRNAAVQAGCQKIFAAALKEIFEPRLEPASVLLSLQPASGSPSE